MNNFAFKVGTLVTGPDPTRRVYSALADNDPRPNARAYWEAAAIEHERQDEASRVFFGYVTMLLPLLAVLAFVVGVALHMVTS